MRVNVLCAVMVAEEYVLSRENVMVEVRLRLR